MIYIIISFRRQCDFNEVSTNPPNQTSLEIGAQEFNQSLPLICGVFSSRFFPLLVRMSGSKSCSENSRTFKKSPAAWATALWEQ